MSSLVASLWRVHNAEIKYSQENRADQTCLTSIICAPSRTHYAATIPFATIDLSRPAFRILTHELSATSSTAGEEQTAQATVTNAGTAAASTFMTETVKLPTTSFTTAVALTDTSQEVMTATYDQPPATPVASSRSFVNSEVHKAMNGSTVGGIVVGTIAGISLLFLMLYLLFRRYKARQDHRNPRNRGVLPGPRVPTGGTVPPSAYRNIGSDGGGTPPTSAQPVRDGEANADPQQDIGLQYYSESVYSQSNGHNSSRKTRKVRPSNIIVSPDGSPIRQHQAPSSPLWPTENDSSTLHSRDSNVAAADWPLPKSTVSSPALLTDALSKTRGAPKISPLSPISPFGDFDAVKEQVEERAETEHHRQEAYKQLSGETPDGELTRFPGSVTRARMNLVATQEAPKKPGSVARARQNMEAERGVCEMPRDVGSMEQSARGLRDFVREFHARAEKESDVEVNETGTVVRRKSKRG